MIIIDIAGIATASALLVWFAVVFVSALVEEVRAEQES